MSDAVKGKKRTESEKQLFVGFTQVSIVAINPTRSELNAILGKEDTEGQPEFVYTGKDNDGNDRIRMTFWLKDESNPLNKKFFVYSFNIINKVRESKTGKLQYINNTCDTTYSDSEENLPNWFTNFMDKEKKNVGQKVTREAKVGEEELAVLLRGWLAIRFNDPDTSIQINPDKLLNEDYRELRTLIGSEYDKSFVALLGVRTDKDDKTKKYQDVYGKRFLPSGFMRYINNNFKFPSDYDKKIWDKFEDEVNGEYGYKSYFELGPLEEYDASKDIADSDDTNADKQKNKVNSDY